MLMFVIMSCQSEKSILERDILPEEEIVEEQVPDTTEEQYDFPCDEPSKAEEGRYISQGQINSDYREPCKIQWHASAGAKDSTLMVSLDLWDSDASATVRVENLLGETVKDWVELTEGQQFEIDLEQTGEFFVQIKAVEEAEERIEYQLGIDCVSGCDKEYTRYPVVFLHGLAGFDSLLNVMDYWVGVQDIYRANGFHSEIHSVPAFDTTYVRVEEWKLILEDLVEQGVGRRFNLIGHSQGGLDARYLASLLDPDRRIVTVTTISTPHYGSSVAGALAAAMNGLPFDGALLNSITELGANIFGVEGEDLSGQLEQMSSENMLTFNEDVPNRADVRYFSWAGKSCRTLQFLCQSEQSGEIVSSYFYLAHAYMELQEGDNDGLVSVDSARWGEFLGVLPADHMDEVGHRFDLSSQPFDATQFYLEEARRLADLGF